MRYPDIAKDRSGEPNGVAGQAMFGDATSPFFKTLEPGWSSIRALGQWPTARDIDSLLSESAHVRFERLPPQRDRKATLYDRRIVEESVVPTRERNLHDLMNALVWATFPASKRALHRRQLGLVTSSAGTGKRTLEHDTIAMLDEGGVLLFDEGDGRIAEPGRSLVFGHAIYQHLAEQRAPVYGLGVSLPPEVQRSAADGASVITCADRALAGMLESGERFISHRCFPRVKVG